MLVSTRAVISELGVVVEEEEERLIKWQARCQRW